MLRTTLAIPNIFIYIIERKRLNQRRHVTPTYIIMSLAVGAEILNIMLKELAWRNAIKSDIQLNISHLYIKKHIITNQWWNMKLKHIKIFIDVTFGLFTRSKYIDNWFSSASGKRLVDKYKLMIQCMVWINELLGRMMFGLFLYIFCGVNFILKDLK